MEESVKNSVDLSIPPDKVELLSNSENFLRESFSSDERTVGSSNKTRRVRFSFDSEDDGLLILKKEKFNEEVKLEQCFEAFNIETFRDKIAKQKCVAIFKVFNNVTVKSRIYVDKSCFLPPEKVNEIVSANHELPKRKKLKILNPLNLLYPKKRKYLINNEKRNSKINGIIKPFGDANIIWSVDSWNTWVAIEGNYIEQTNDYLIYEASLINAHDHIDNIGNTIEFVACYQNDYGVFKDTNNHKCYAFKCVSANKDPSEI